MSLDPARTVAAGRRRRRRTATAAATVVVLPVAGAVALVPLRVGPAPWAVAPSPTPTATPSATPTPTPSATPTPPARPTATAAPTASPPEPPAPGTAPAPAVLAAGLEAATGVARVVLDDGSTWWDTGLRDGSGREGLALRASRGTGSSPVTHVDLGGIRDGALGWTNTLHHDPFATLEDHGPGAGYGSVLGTQLGGTSWEDPHGRPLEVGAVPGWMPGARVALLMSYGTPRPDGTTVHVVELPTFTLDSAPGTTLFAYTANPGVLLDARHGEGAPAVWGHLVAVFVGTDGTCYINGMPVTPALLADWLRSAPIDDVLAGLRALGARI